MGDIAELYMVFGGIPFYWSLLKKGKSVAQNIDNLLFSQSGKLKNEFHDLYSSLFGENALYVEIVRALSQVKCGIEKGEILKRVGMAKGGNAKRYLDDLERCGFIRKYTAFGKKKRDATYQLIDNFSLFYLKFIDGESNLDAHFWEHSVLGAELNVWRGLAFERLCLLHLDQMKVALGISGVLTRVFSWRHIPDDEQPEGAQIDLLVERADRIIDVCEMKWASGIFSLSKEAAAKLRDRCEIFREITGVRKAVHVVLVSPFGLRPNVNSGIVQNVITLDDLFRK